MSSHLAYLVLGSNLGNRSTNLTNAKTEIRALSETRILKESEIYKSAAYGPIDQPFFFNLALEVETKFSPLVLLEHLQIIETKLKREKNSHMKPRTIDIDIVFFDDEIIETPLLKVPHYDWQNRDFFINPLKEIDCQAQEFKNFSFD